MIDDRTRSGHGRLVNGRRPEPPVAADLPHHIIEFRSERIVADPTPGVVPQRGPHPAAAIDRGATA